MFNSAVLLQGGKVQSRFRKWLLPTYDVFDEDRYFESAPGHQLSPLDGWTIGITICEDIWNDRDFLQRRHYQDDPVEILIEAGANCVVNLSASPFTMAKDKLRGELLSRSACRD